MRIGRSPSSDSAVMRIDVVRRHVRVHPGAQDTLLVFLMTDARPTHGVQPDRFGSRESLRHIVMHLACRDRQQRVERRDRRVRSAPTSMPRSIIVRNGFIACGAVPPESRLVHAPGLPPDAGRTSAAPTPPGRASRRVRSATCSPSRSARCGDVARGNAGVRANRARRTPAPTRRGPVRSPGLRSRGRPPADPPCGRRGRTSRARRRRDSWSRSRRTSAYGAISAAVRAPIEPSIGRSPPIAAGPGP